MVGVPTRCAGASGNCHSRQRRVPGEALSEARKRLLAAGPRACRSLDEVHSLGDSLIREIYMASALVVYGGSHRIGAHLGLEPERVYFHAENHDGARALGIGRERSALDLDELPPEFGRLSPAEVEDCPCLYKEAIRRARG